MSKSIVQREGESGESEASSVASGQRSSFLLDGREEEEEEEEQRREGERASERIRLNHVVMRN